MSAVTITETESFVAALRAQSRRYHDQHPFHRKMNEGKLSPGQVRGWVANRFYYQESIPRKDAAIIANCPDRDVRRRWVRRILDHDGPYHDDAGGSEGGIEAWLRLAAFERYYPWIDPAGLAYFRARLSQAPRDSQHALQVVTQQCRTPDQQAAAVAALSFKCDVLWSMLDAIDRAYADR